jgi:NAD(P)-dependent dehydrogenase (short-subunit alcohol dehydrogenase family)
MTGEQKPLKGKNILITGGAVRVGREIGLSLAAAGANLVIHYNSSAKKAVQTQQDIQANGVEAHLIQADLSEPAAGTAIIAEAESYGPLYALINNASIFDAIEMPETSLEDWNRHLDINLTAPFILTQAFAAQLGKTRQGRIINILDWRALRPGTDHFPYTISKAGLAALTQSSAQALAPNITVNGIAFGAILPPSDGGDVTKLLEQVPAGRWAEMKEVGDTVRFLLEGPAYITGEIIHLDGGRHLV